MTTPPRTAPLTPPPRARVPAWDNARFLCVTLVVVGHGIQRLTHDNDVALATYLTIYAFHMPAFAIISGHFSRPGPPSRRQMTTVLTDILLPYVIMESIWTLLKVVFEGATINPTTPSWTLWFLLALAIFRLVLPYLALLRWPLAWAVALSVGVGYLDNVDNTFSLSRAIGILPFFVLGWKLREWGLAERWMRARRAVLPARALAAVVLAAWATTVWLFIDRWRESELRLWFLYDESYASIGQEQWWAGAVRLGFLCLAVLLSLAFFVLVPRGRSTITRLGQATMYIYLLHSFVLYPIRQSGFLQEHTGPLWLLIMIAASILISVLLGSRGVRRVFRPLIEPRPRWLFADALREASRTDPTGSRRTR